MNAASDQPIAVRCRDLIKYFGEGEGRIAALRGVDLDVRFGELFMLVGPSGCGKTTLLSIIASVIDSDAGECVVLGRDLALLSPAEKARLRREDIGFVFQSYNLIASLSVAENVAIPLLLNRRPREEALAAAERILARLGLGGRGSSRPTDLSGGQQQRVAIARALVHEPRILLCDEPTSALDAKSGDELLRMFREIALETDRALIIVTHDNRIFKYADRIAEMEDGIVKSLRRSATMADDPSESLLA
ncbi:ABC transporter ATP-binding protein [Methylosinus sp. H3A]|uniref:ABC transporter ATP-binding protein n=1 Tax=Methylosinus sp. H3A TaxID=2785786 RepID=UPI0018C2A041|nr:ABC transporter ATP-binding protein [Methylosinus sp. H3A]MBG0809945.1 ABC transporter ATP-binding protein [Methylosinus sp. H3A]